MYSNCLTDLNFSIAAAAVESIKIRQGQLPTQIYSVEFLKRTDFWELLQAVTVAAVGDAATGVCVCVCENLCVIIKYI